MKKPATALSFSFIAALTLTSPSLYASDYTTEQNYVNALKSAEPSTHVGQLSVAFQEKLIETSKQPFLIELEIKTFKKMSLFLSDSPPEVSQQIKAIGKNRRVIWDLENRKTETLNKIISLNKVSDSPLLRYTIENRGFIFEQPDRFFLVTDFELNPIYLQVDTENDGKSFTPNWKSRENAELFNGSGIDSTDFICSFESSQKSSVKSGTGFCVISQYD